MYTAKAPEGRSIFQLEFSADGRWIVGAIGDHRSNAMLAWWDAKSGEFRGTFESKRFSDHRFRNSVLAFAHDSQRLCISSGETDEMVVTVWDWPAMLRGDKVEPIAVLRGHGSNITKIDFSPNGRRILTCGGGIVKLWDAVSGGELVNLTADGVALDQAYFHPDGEKIWAGFDDRRQPWGWNAPRGPKKP